MLDLSIVVDCFNILNGYSQCELSTCFYRLDPKAKVSSKRPAPGTIKIKADAAFLYMEILARSFTTLVTNVARKTH
jgi:hypothetical protein